jgi:hypothetical protein
MRGVRVGRHYNTIEITGSVSRHNEERDRADDRSWEELVAEIRAVIAQDKYADLRPEIRES